MALDLIINDMQIPIEKYGVDAYILAASHTIPPETPLENIFALYEAAGITKEQIYDVAAEIRKGFSVSSNNHK